MVKKQVFRFYGFPVIALYLLYPLGGCNDIHNRGEYSITVYFTSYDSDRLAHDDCGKKLGEKFLYSYKEYNVDSNVVIAEYYTDGDPRFKSCWSWGTKPWDIWKTTWKDKEKVSAKRETSLTLLGATSKVQKVDYSYRYRNGRLVTILEAGKIVAEYDYDDQGKQKEKREFDDGSLWKKTSYQYDKKGLEAGETFFARNKFIYCDSFLNDKNGTLVEIKRFDSLGGQVGDRLFILDSTGKYSAEKGDEDPDHNESRQEIRNIYNRAGQKIRSDYYSNGKLTVVFEYVSGLLRH